MEEDWGGGVFEEKGRGYRARGIVDGQRVRPVLVALIFTEIGEKKGRIR
jgi:hypothetical protein